MEKYYFKTIGSEPDEQCVEKCHVHDNGIMIGSYSCTKCEFHKGNDLDPDNKYSSMSWLKCSKLSEARGGVRNFKL